MDVMNPVLAHKVGLAPDAKAKDDGGAISPTRMMRRAVARAADKAVGMSASVLGVSEEQCSAEELIEDAPQDWIVLGLRDGDEAGLTGLFLIDPPLRSALVEMQTMGTLLPAPDEQRKITGTDAVMSIPFAAKLLSELDEIGFGASGGTIGGNDIGPIENIRTASLVLTQGTYSVWRVTLQMGGGDTQGELLVAVRTAGVAQDAPVEDGSEWAAAFQKSVESVATQMDAVLARMKLPISAIETFEVGQVVPLVGTTVGSVTLTCPEGKYVAHARLGQVAGKRAVRIETPNVELQEAMPSSAIDTDAVEHNTGALIDG